MKAIIVEENPKSKNIRKKRIQKNPWIQAILTIDFFKCFLISLVFLLIGCGTIPYRPGYNRQIGRTTNKGIKVSRGYSEMGYVSYYGPGFHGKKTANGETYNQNGLTAAHKTLPFNTKIKVTLKETGKSIVVRINDRGPFAKGRILDLSVGAAKKIGLIKKGVGKAKIKVL